MANSEPGYARFDPWARLGLKAITPLKRPRFKLLKPIAFDTEAYRYRTTKGERQELAQFDFFDGNNHYSGKTKAELYSTLNDILTAYKHITVIAHNYNYDLRVSGLLNHILIDKEILGLPVVTAFLSSIIYVRAELTNRRKRIDLLDSTNYFKFPLRKMGEALGEKKTATEDEYASAPDDWNRYLDSVGFSLIRNDTEILYRYFTAFASRNDITLGVSLAATSFNTYRKYFLKNVLTIPVDKIPDALLSYRGGRVEPYFLGDEHTFIHDYDINSLYPYVMKRYRYSTEFIREISGINEDVIANIKNEARNYLFQVDYRYIEPVLRLPVVVKDAEGRLIQSYQSKDKWITGRELLYLLDDGAEVYVHKGYEFRNEDIFSGFVDYFYAQKEESQEPARTNYKLLLNSLYGKFGQSKRKTFFISVSDLPDDVRWIIERHPDKQRLRINGIVYSIYGAYVTNMELEGKAAYNPLIASEVTANARLHNYDIQKRIGFSNVVYTDTDSFFSTRVVENMVSSSLGDLKEEHTGMAKIYDSKDYEIIKPDGTLIWKIKGVSLNKIEDMYYEDGTQIFEMPVFKGFKNRNEVMDSVEVWNIRKKLSRLHSKLNYVRVEGGLLGFPREIA